MKHILLVVLYSGFLRFFMKLILGVKYINREVLKTRGQFIIIANHNSHLDAVTLMTAMPSRLIHKVHPAAASDYFGNSVIKSFLSRTFINVLLIPRSKPKDGQGPDPLDLMSQILLAGESLILFPEGTRGEPEVMQQFKRGIGLLIEKFPDIPVIPVYLEGLGKSLPRGESILVPFNSIAYFGEPEKITLSTPESIAKELEEKITSLKTKIALKENKYL